MSGTLRHELVISVRELLGAREVTVSRRFGDHDARLMVCVLQAGGGFQLPNRDTYQIIVGGVALAINAFGTDEIRTLGNASAVAEWEASG